jgi:hypothetical protein
LSGASPGEIPGGCTLSICHEEEGYSFCIRSAGGELLLLAGESFENEAPGATVTHVQETIAGNPFLARRDYEKVIIAACYREKMLLPDRFFREEQLPLLWSFYRDFPGGDRTLSRLVKEWNAHVVGTLPSRIEQLYKRIQPDCIFLPGGLPLVQLALQTCSIDREYLLVDVHDDYVDLLLVRDRRPLLFNAFPRETEDDILYVMLHAARTCHLDEKHARLVLTGHVSPRGPLHEHLSRYWSSPLLVTEPALNALARDAALNTTPFIHLLNLHACES